MSDLTAVSATCSARLGPRSCTRAPHISGRHADAEGTWLGHTPPVLTLADTAELVAACMTEGREIAEEKIGATGQPPLDPEETELLNVGLAAGVAGALRVLERIAGQLPPGAP